jgi:hypothetical protein
MKTPVTDIRVMSALLPLIAFNTGRAEYLRAQSGDFGEA